MKRRRNSNEDKFKAETPDFLTSESEKEWWEMKPPGWPLSSFRDEANDGQFFTMEQFDRYSIEGSQMSLTTTDSAARIFGRGHSIFSRGLILLQDTECESKKRRRNSGSIAFAGRYSSLSTTEQQAYLQLEERQNVARVVSIKICFIV